MNEQERAAVLERLWRGYEDGWLTPDEHELRVTLARRATTREELERAARPGPLSDSANDGVVSPVPPLVERPVAAAAPAPVQVCGSADAPAKEQDEKKDERGLIPVPDYAAEKLAVLAPFGAIALLITTGNWWTLLTAPVVWALVGGGLTEQEWEEHCRRKEVGRREKADPSEAEAPPQRKEP